MEAREVSKRKTFSEGEDVEVVPDSHPSPAVAEWKRGVYLKEGNIPGWHWVKLGELERAFVPSRRVRKLRLRIDQ